MTTQAGLYIEQLKETIKAQQVEIDTLLGLLRQWVEIGPKLSWTVDYHGDIRLGDETDTLIEATKSKLSTLGNQD